jgi:hypothetical protein
MRDITGKHPVAKDEAIPVPTYRRLMELVAQLSYLNMDHLLFFRGQVLGDRLSE